MSDVANQPGGVAKKKSRQEVNNLRKQVERDSKVSMGGAQIEEEQQQ